MIKHYKFLVHITTKKSKIVYLCNWAISPNRNKLTNDINKVTCKNCLRILKNMEYFGEK